MKYFILITAILISSPNLLAQFNPVQWSSYVNKKSTSEFEVHIKAEVADEWHIYSQFTDPGGAFPTVFIFNKNPLLSIEKYAVEKGKIEVRYEPLFKDSVKYFNGNAEFVFLVKSRSNVKTKLVFNVKYMACTNEKCLTPQSRHFDIALE